MSSRNNNLLDSHKINMYLIYAQSIELQILYYQQISKNNYEILKYYLVPKLWLDDYKSKFNYDSIKKEIKLEDCQDYNNFISSILKKNNNKTSEVNYHPLFKEHHSII